MEKKALALFDFDGTMIRGDSIAAYVLFAFRRGKASLPYLGRLLFAFLSHALRKKDLCALKTAALSFLSPLSLEQRRAFDRSFVLERLMPRVYPDAAACLAKCRREGKITVLITASTENYMGFAAKALGFDACLATPVDAQGRVTNNCKGEEKVRRLRLWLEENEVEADTASSCAYGDSKSDLPMLRFCGHAALVNPKKALRRAAPDLPRLRWR